MKRLAGASNVDWAGCQSGGGGDMLEKLLAYAGSTVLGVLQLGYPVVNGSIELGKCLFLFEDGLVAEFSHTRRAEILADAGV